MLQFISNALAKALIVSDQNPLPCVVVTGYTFDPGFVLSDKNPLPVTQV